MINNITNHYLTKAVKELESEMNNMNAVTNFIHELKVSNLFIPGIDNGEELVFETLISEDEDLVYLPLFTSEDEFYKHYSSDGEFLPIDNEFEIYAGIAADENVDGIIIDVESISFEIPKEIIEYTQVDFSVSIDDIKIRSINEIKDVYEKPSSEDLLKFIKDESNQDNFEGLMAEISFANLLNLVVSDESLDEFAKDGAIQASDVDGFTLYCLEDDESRYAVMFTDHEAILKAIQDDGMNYYGQLTKVSELFEFVLRNDMDGVIINPFAEEFTIPRSEIISQASGIELIPEDASFRNSLEYAFLL